MRIGILGVGTAGTVHARNVVAHPQVDEVVLLGRSEERLQASARALAEAAARGPGPAGRVGGRETAAASGGEEFRTALRVGTDVEAALPDLDGLVVATASPAHPHFVRLAAAAGVPVLVEKPLALTVEETLALVDELGDAPVSIGFPRRFDPGYRELARRVHAGEAGTVRSIRLTGHDRNQIPLDYIAGSGGIFRDMGVHDFDAALWLMREVPTSVYATGAVIEEEAFARAGDVDTALVVLGFASGATATLSLARHLGNGHEVSAVVYGNDTVFGAGFCESHPMVSTQPGDEPPESTYADYRERFASAFAAETDHLVRMSAAVAAGTWDPADNPSPPCIAPDAIGLALAAEESRRTGVPVPYRSPMSR